MTVHQKAISLSVRSNHCRQSRSLWLNWLW